ncbi:MAG: GNAT family N-acetyltransferase [Lachnospiraceae bacterium]|nr:GNAT family N-acetyltransferase [Lachnospiraceae bacterium]
MEIIKLNDKNITDINKANQPFEIIGRINPTFADGNWTYIEEIYEQPYIKRYSNDSYDPTVYIDNPDKAIYLAYLNEECIGQIVLRRDWNQYAFIEDICVAQAFRGEGVGTALIQKATEWAKKSGLNGLALETQDNNLSACRFYTKCGFVIGAVNTMLYKNFDNGEFAVFWYLKF